MADLHIEQLSTHEPSSLEASERASNEKLQQLARSMVSSLYMLIRSIKMYEADNSVFEKPMQQLIETTTLVLQKEGRLDFLGVKQAFYLNSMLIKVDMASLDNVKLLLEEFHSKDVAGFNLTRQLTLTELRHFISLFASDQHEMAQEDGFGKKRLISLKIAQWSKLKHKLESENDESEAKLDRKKFALTCYARAVFFTQKYLESLRAQKPLNTSKSLRVIQDLIDIVYDQKVHFLGLSTTRVDGQYLAYHQVNTCLIALVFGNELGLTKPQLRDLGYIALFHESGLGLVDDSILSSPGKLDAAARALVAKAPLVAVQNILKEKTISRATLLRLVATVEHKSDFGAAIKDTVGNIEVIINKEKLGLYSRLIAMCATFDALTSKRAFRDAYAPEVALMLMWTELRHRFDPELLQVFMRVMAITPIRILTKRQQSLHVGML